MKTNLHLRHYLILDAERLLLFLPWLLSWGIAFGQQDVFLPALVTNHSIRQLYSEDSSGNATYDVINQDGRTTGKYKGMVIKIYPDTHKGDMNLQIESKRDRNILVELRSRSDDELLFEELKLKAGKNIIPFETDDETNDSYKINLSSVHSNRMASYVVMKN